MSIQRSSTAEEALLMELAELGMGLVRRLHEAALATEDSEDLVAVANAYCQVGRGVRQSLALGARFAAGTVVTDRPTRAEAAAPSRPERDETEREETERSNWNEYERPDWNTPLEALSEPLDLADHDELEACVTRIARDLTVVSRTPVLYAIPTVRPQAERIAGRAALLRGASLRLVDTS